MLELDEEGSVRSDDAELQPGRSSWQEKFTGTSELGHGGFGRVLRVTDRTTGELFALKEPRSKDEETVRRFRREVELQDSLRHPNVMPILGTGDDWYIMPIASTSLADKAPDLYEPELMKALSQVAAGLAQAHAKGLVHRDVKPSNILLLTDNANTRWVIGDFGLVRRPLGQTTALATSRPLGTPEFMAPEAFAGIHKVGPTADVYSLGKTLLWALTGRTDGEGPKDWEELIAAMTAPHVDDRVPSMAEFQVRLAKVGESLRQQRRTVWGQPALSLSDDEVEVLEAILSTMQIRPGDDSPSATLTQLERECHTLTLGGIRLQVTRLVGKDLIWEGSHPDSWGIAAAGWRWLRSNQHRLHLKKPPPDSDIPF